MNCVDECFGKDEISSSQKQAIITLIEKKEKERSLLETWRPISLVKCRHQNNDESNCIEN